MARWMLTLLLALSALSGPVRAALPQGTLEYVQRTGVVGPDDPIDVWLRFTLGPNSAPLTFTSNPLSGFAPGDLPLTGQRFDAGSMSTVHEPFEVIHQAMLQSWFACNTTFFSGCDGPGEYSWAPAGDRPGHPSPDGDTSFTLDPGESIEYAFITLQPKAGGAAPGTYRLFTSGFQIRFDGENANGDVIYAWHGLASQCNGQFEDCAFTRTVRGVDAPATPVLLLAALAALSMTRRRERTH